MIRPLGLARLMAFSLASFVAPATTASAPSLAVGPLPRSSVQIRLSRRFNRAVPHPDPLVEASIEQLWAAHKQRAPRLFNGTKFRLHDWRLDAGNSRLSLQCGLTDYKAYLGTCCSTLVTQLRRDGERLRAGDATAFLSRKVGVSGVVETRDQRVALIERSRSVGVYQQLFDTPGGHPEPSDLPFTMEDLETLEEGSERATAVEALAVERLFGSIVDEVHEEINLSPTQLSDPLLLGVVFQSEAETPSFVFHMATPLSSEEVDALYRLGPQDKFESTRLCWVDQSTLDKYQLTPAAQGSLSLWQQFCAFRTTT